MNTFKSFVASMQQVTFEHDIVRVRNQKRKEFIYSVEDFWGRVLPAYEQKLTEEQA